jgi:hypothetical protein
LDTQRPQGAWLRRVDGIVDIAANPIDSPIYPRRPLLYATLVDIIDTEHADQAALAIRPLIASRHHEQVAGVMREVARRAYVDGLRDGFVQGVELAAENGAGAGHSEDGGGVVAPPSEAPDKAARQ